MKTKIIFSILALLLSVLFTSILTAQNQNAILDTPISQKDKYLIQRIVLPDGRIIEARHTPSPPTPPPGFARKPVILPKRNRIAADYTLPDVPAFNWSFGCSATSAAMIAGYYDRIGFSNMYAGPTNGGVMPMDNSSWPDWFDGTDDRHQCPLSATHNGLDGRTVRGHVDDYWIAYGDAGPDSFIVNGWTEHEYGDCTGDYMKTNQSNYGNSDASTTFYNFTNGSPLTWDVMEDFEIDHIDGGYGLKLFYESRGYSVSDMYNQYIYGYEGNILGFTFDQYMAEIDAGRPVMIHVEGHTMVGFGYDDVFNLMYIHDTWDYSTYTMTWGESYSGMLHYGVTIVILQTPEITLTNGADASLNFLQSGPSPPQTDWAFGQFSLTSDAAGATINGVTIHLSGSYTGLEGTHPFRLFASNSNDFSSATEIGTDAASSGGSVIFSSLNDELPSGVRYYWVTADLSVTAGGTMNSTIFDASDWDITNGTINITSSYGLLNSGEDVSLPVELSSFSAHALNGQIMLKWTTQSELNNLGYIIARSAAYEGPFRKIASYNEQETLKGRGNTANTTNYTFYDKDVVSGCMYYYQLTSVDFDGSKSSYGPVHCSLSPKEMQVMTDDGFPVMYALHQNYPNPFNPRTIINYELPITSFVEVSIYTTMGKKVVTLVSEKQQAGFYKIEWNASGFASGVYYYQLRADTGFIRTKKLILMR